MRRTDPNVVVTSAAYLLFYRRRSEDVLGGPFLQKHFDKAGGIDSTGSKSNSRATSPAGEGKCLDDSSRNGSLSGLHVVGAAHQAGGGGSMDGAIISMRTGVDDDLPAYSMNDPRSTVDPKYLQGEDTLESLESLEEEDEGIGGMTVMHGPFPNSPYGAASWSFNNTGSQSRPSAPPASVGEADDEDLFADAASNKAVGSSSGDEDERNKMADFGDDEGITPDVFDSPVRGTTPMLDVPPSHMEDIQAPTTEIMLEDQEPLYGIKMD